MNRAVKKQQGFTLIELILAMAFIGALLLAIAMVIIQIGGIYNQGITLKEINQVSRDVSDDLRRNILSSGTINLATDYVQQPLTGAAVGGRLCLGSYSYIWNYAKTPLTDTNFAKYQDPPGPDGVPADPIRFVRVADPARLYCQVGSTSLTYKDIRAIDVLKSQELLKAGDHELGLHQFTFVTPVPASATNDAISQSMYSIRFTIGTSEIAAMNPTQTACLPANDPNSDPLYCNVQQFTLVVRAGK